MRTAAGARRWKQHPRPLRGQLRRAGFGDVARSSRAIGGKRGVVPLIECLRQFDQAAQTAAR